MRADFSELEILETLQSKGHKILICKCRTKNCSNKITVRPSNRHLGYCINCKYTKRRKRPYEALYNSFKQHYARRKGVEVPMTYEEFANLAEINNCHYCNASTVRSMHRDGNWSTGYMLDRKDNNLGYTSENCVSCCWPCNDLKSDRFTYEQFVKLRTFMKNELKI